jgi:kynurenine formamidase
MPEWHDLSQEFYDGMPHSSVHPTPSLETLSCVEEETFNVQEFTAVTHVCTHVDAPRHFLADGATIDEIDLSTFAGEGVVVDVSREEATEITLEEFEAAPGEVREGDIVLVYTGWGERYGAPDYEPHPWLSTPLAEWLVERDVKLVGLDVITPDLTGPYREEGWTEYPVHRTLLGNGVLIAEHLGGLGAVAGRRLDVYAFPLKIRGGDGAQARFVGRTD